MLISSLFSFMDMGEYAVYIWSCYGLFLALISLQVFSTIRRHARIKNAVKQNLWHNSKNGVQSDAQI